MDSIVTCLLLHLAAREMERFQSMLTLPSEMNNSSEEQVYTSLKYLDLTFFLFGLIFFSYSLFIFLPSLPRLLKEKHALCSWIVLIGYF